MDLKWEIGLESKLVAKSPAHGKRIREDEREKFFCVLHNGRTWAKLSFPRKMVKVGEVVYLH